MRKTLFGSEILRSGGLWIHGKLGRYLDVGFPVQCAIVTAICALPMFLTSSAEHSLYLPGRDVGSLEHPAVWAFLILQIGLPISLARSINLLRHTAIRHGELTNQGAEESDLIIPSVQRFLSLKDKESQRAATLVYCIGVGAWALNTYQNQFPLVMVPYDFWDSTTFVWGYAITRFYKLYLFVFLLPYLALVHIAILVVTLRVVRKSRLSGELKLLPFHPDGLGGLGFVAGLISKPIVWTLVVGAMANAGAFMIHRAANITPIAGLLILLGWALLAYLVPILYLRVDILTLKTELIKKLRSLQQSDYSKVFADNASEFRVLRKEKEALEYFDKVCTRVQSISTCPHWKRFVTFTSLAATPSVLAVLFKSLIGLVLALGRVLGKV